MADLGNPLRCFICYDGFLQRERDPIKPRPVSVSKLSSSTSALYTKVIVQLLIKNKSSSERLDIQTNFEQCHYCSDCTEDLGCIYSILQQLDRLKNDIGTARAKLIEQIQSNYAKLGKAPEDEREKSDQRLRGEIVKDIQLQQQKMQVETQLSSTSCSLPTIKLVRLEQLMPSNEIDDDQKVNIGTCSLEMETKRMSVRRTRQGGVRSANSINQTKTRNSATKRIEFQPLPERANIYSGFVEWNDNDYAVGKDKTEVDCLDAMEFVNTKIEIECDYDPGIGAVSRNQEEVAQEKKYSPAEAQIPLASMMQGRTCWKCKRKFSRKSYLAKHIVTCTGKGLRPTPIVPSANSNYQCRICGVSLTHYFLGRHMQQFHSEEKKEFLECKECGKMCRDLKHHIAITHPTTFTCDICSATFTNIIEFNYHETTHPELNLPPVKCDECGKLFLNNQYLRIHISTMHLGQFKANCTLCPFGGRNQSHVDRHMKAVHSKLKDFECSLCDAKFTSSSYFNVHLSKHKGEEVKNFKCTFCSKLFRDSGKLKNHEAAIHGAGAKKHICDVCGKAFPIYNYLYIHLRSHETLEQKTARILKAKLAAEARKQSGKPVLVAKGRPRIRPVKIPKLSQTVIITHLKSETIPDHNNTETQLVINNPIPIGQEGLQIDF